MHPGYGPVFLWSVVIFVSFLGYGEALRRLLRRPEFDDLGWGLSAAWGMAVTLVIAGGLMALKLAIAPILAVVVGIGAVLACAQAIRSIVANGFSFPVTWPSLSDILLFLFAALAFASSIAWRHQIDPNDDLICYLMLPVKLLSTGTLIEPFSFQRAGTFGGQAILQALVMIVGGERNGHVPDRGMAMLMIFGMLLHATRGLKGQYAVARFLLLFAFWFVPVPRISTNGAMTGGALLLAMVVTLERCLASKSREWVSFVPAGLLLAGTCSIRPTFAVASAFILAALALRDLAGSPRDTARPLAALTPYLKTGLVAIAALTPFMAVLYASNGTPLIPPWSGYVSKAYQTFAFPDAGQSASAALAFFLTFEGLCLLSLLAVAAIFLRGERVVVMVYALVLTSFVILFQFSALAFLDLYRYLFPIIVPLALWLLASVLARASSKEPSPTPSARLPVSVDTTVVALAIFLAINAAAGGNELRAQLMELPDQVREVKPFFDPNLRRAYATLQARVPAGEKILTMVDASFWFDFQRNPIYSINAVGGSSPPPGLPFGEGPDALAAYLKGLGIRYVIAVDFDNAVLLYTRKLWNEGTRPEWFYRELWKPRFNDFMDNIDALAKREGGLVATAANARLIDLGE